MKNDDLIIPEMEDINEIKSKIKKDEKPISNDEVKENREEKKIVIEKTNPDSTNTEDFMTYLHSSIQKMIDFKKDYKKIFKQASIGNVWGFMKGKYLISMPISKGHNRYLSTILSKISKISGADYMLTMGGAINIVIQYLRYLEKKFSKLIEKKRPFLNNQNFAEDEYANEEVVKSEENLDTPQINDNERMNFLEDGINTAKEIRDGLLSFDLLDSYTINTIQEVMNSFANGMKKAKKYAMIRLKRGWSFSELTKKLDNISRGL